ncbi:maleylpyruvate isomerase N-terminal domain-containing protein [Polyangium sp. y55x31]|uniref:maleylpyruvate isomerase N-terminal domain-containing protein n=1 Tax=Polyangium sp. y55x31 TaxID=3042688 RepID=UPI0024823859|nr:maleylpyruvate isomerase N-terminal domain-containing protein [Polyangium sp. y55x31]MDI1476215.1 maleylpyruvate isomerase N-terminal domain-containing protein [Polyangium sp. y55x31]
MTPLPPIPTAHLFRDVSAALHDLLGSLGPDDWSKPTVHATRDVKDLAAHLLDGSLRRLSFQRDGHVIPAPEMRSFEAMVEFIQRLNSEWMVAARRLSPRMLVDMLRQADEEVAVLFEGLAPEGPAIFSVAWAGEEWSQNWFDVAREYTEKWHHQQQIRDAVGRPGLKERRYMHPVIDAFLRGAPHAYRDVPAADGAGVDIVITGEAGGTWQLVRAADRWELVASRETTAQTTVELDADSAWRLWTKGKDPTKARAEATIRGDEALAAPIFRMVTIMA